MEVLVGGRLEHVEAIAGLEVSLVVHCKGAALPHGHAVNVLAGVGEAGEEGRTSFFFVLLLDRAFHNF